MVFNTQQFMTLATFAMCNDLPENTECIDVQDLHDTLDEIAIVDLGFDSWIDAYHKIES